ncbi:hypothetical protein ACQKIE_17405 [Luteibacter sp. NPDC031894]|uniref:poly(ethylene terephthalate) hydrolase family protein n=1 Tax=Luteibacter sp. NPDC031894 TaxID=3390572 RepID=UPI003D036AE1
MDDIDVQGTVWPCPAPSMPVSSYQGYAGAGELLASHGYVVVSISANGINALDVEEVGGDQYIARGELVLQHLDLLRKANAGRVESLRALHGRLDMQRIGLMGHSRGGEGVVRAALLNAERGSPFGIRSLMPLASVNERSSIPGVPMASVLPYCDGDVSTLEGQAFVDDGAHAFGDSALRTTVLMMGANHNFYNSVWSEEGHGGDDVELASDFADDATCGVGRSTRLTQAEQEHLGAGYMAAWFRLTLGREGRFLPLFDGTSASLRGLPRADVRSVPVLPSEDRLDVLTAALRLGDWRAGGGVQARWCAEAAVDIDDCPRREEEAIDVRQPHWSSGLGESGTMLRVDWAGAGTLSVMLPRQSRRTGRMERLSMRVMTGLSAPGGMRLTLHDRWGRRASVQLDAQAHATLGALPEVNGIGTSLLQAVQVPLARFRGIDLRHLRRLDIDREEPGTLFLTDVAFTRSSVGMAQHASHWPGIAVESQPPMDSRGPSERQDVRVTATLSGRQSYPVTVNVRLGTDSRAVTVPPGNLCAGTSLQFAPSVDPDVDESMAFIASGNSSGGFTSNRQIPVGPAGVRNDGRTAVVCREE